MNVALEEKLKNLPINPGVYQFKGGTGGVIYVGKAKNLRSRVRSYFQQNRPRDAKTTALVAKIADIEVIVTDTAVEALILEDTLIKKLRPRYNIMLRDDKTYPRIRVTNEQYPRVFATRKIIRDGSRYFGPYTDAGYVRSLLKTLRSIFPIRSCDLPLTTDTIEAGRYKVCLDYHIGKCEGPCENLVSQVEYAAVIDQVVQVLKGKSRVLEQELEREMGYYAEAMKFEKAAAVRDRLNKLRAYNARQKVVTEDDVDRDVIAIAREDDDAAAVVLKIRDGRLNGRRQHYLSGVLHAPAEELLRTVLRTHYAEGEPPPGEIFVEIDPAEEYDDLLQYLRERRDGEPVKLIVPKIGEKQHLVGMASANAALILGELRMQKLKQSDMIPRSVESLKRDLRLPRDPRRIECFDNSNFHGTDPVASMVCFVDGKPRRSEYRKFKIRTVEGPDDFASMQEVVSRRYRRVLDEGLALPDLIVIDGGKGQVSAAKEAVDALGLGHIPLIGLAKRLEEIVIPEESDTLLLPKSSSSLRLLQQIRDEAHRFAITFHRSLRDKRTIATELTSVPGIGEAKAKRILEKLGSVRRIREMSLTELQEAVGTKTGASLFEYFKNAPDEQSDDGSTNDESASARDNQHNESGE